MIESLSDLRILTDDEVVSRYDLLAEHTVGGTQYYLDELNLRAQDRQTKTMLRFTKWVT